MKNYNINSIETMSCVDGPGIRMVIFVNGCDKRCKYCHNPEMWSGSNKVDFLEIVTKVVSNKPYYDNGGGVTISGGEPLLQPLFVKDMGILCKEKGVNLALETSGMIVEDESVLENVDLIMLDIKHYDAQEYYKLTGRKIDGLLYFLELMMKLKKRLWIRQVIIPDYNDNVPYIEGLKRFLDKYNYDRLELLPYHTMGVSKYDDLKMACEWHDVPAMDVERVGELSKLYCEL